MSQGASKLDLWTFDQLWPAAAPTQESIVSITLESGQFGWDYIVASDNGQEVLIQSDTDYPGTARTFGWDGDDDDIEAAQAFLDDNIGASVEDPGYFA
jgi:hypothetical protein